MAQQTAVEILLEYIEQRIYKVYQLDDDTYLNENIYMSLPINEFRKIREKTKAMEKEQMIDAFSNGAEWEKYEGTFDDKFKQYYNETYNK
jgi:hypothetical protein